MPSPGSTLALPVVASAPRDSPLSRVLDLVVSLVLLLLAAPVLAAVAVAIALDSPGPVFFQQQRTGYLGTRFGMWKFRTMVPDASALRAALESANQYREGTLFKMADDPRITRVGRWLRRSSLDELPQLLNVVKGEMALVGPRPTSTRFDEMEPEYRRRTLVRPGLTGLWQVSGRSRLSWSDSVRLDLDYLERRSLWLDLSILFRTLPAVLKRDGAY
jgi:lipopolysaccharide/colanic/teichoic acid biosynthesis glycosyltransferase